MYTGLAIICHPDDMEFYCAGTLLKCKARGDRIVVCNLSSGNLGHMTIKPGELVLIRDSEAKDSCDIGGFEHIYGGFDDLDIYENNRESRNKVVRIIRQVNPDFIITHYPNDYMSDHIATSNLAREAAYAASNPLYAPEIKGKARPMPIYYMQPEAGIGFSPTDYVDVTEYMELKYKMIKCHKSQYEWLEEHDNIDMTEEIRVVSKYNGYQCGVEFAESFALCMTSPKLITKRLLP